MGNDSSAWPRRFPAHTLGWLVAALLASLALIRLWGYFEPARWFYLPQFERARLSVWTYQLANGFRPKPEQARAFTFEDGTTSMQKPSAFVAAVASQVYENQPLSSVLFWPLCGGGVLVILALVIGGFKDARYNREAYKGRLVRGPKMVTDREFNRATKGDGIAIQSGKKSVIRIAKDREAHHIQIAGSTGSGKSTIVRTILYQIEQRGEVAIVFDPDREYIKEFFDESRGDWVLNPKDDRCPFWPMGEEAQDEAEATAITKALYQQESGDHSFFVNHARAITAYLLAIFRPTPGELADWIASEDGVDSRVKGTEHASTLTKTAGPQRAGVFGHLNQAAKPLRMMPRTEDGRRKFLIRDWVKERRGYLFITSTPDTIDALRPLQSLWLDILILKIQNSQPGARRVWMILDEVASLNELPQLHAALTRQRKSNNPLVLGFQGMSQIEHLYGDKMAQTILSQAFTNIILRTRESKAAHYLSELIGKQELERVRENRPATILPKITGRTYYSEKVTVPVVLESEIQGLNDLEGYFVQLGMVVKINFEPLPRRVRAADLIERVIPPTRVMVEETRPVPVEVPYRGEEKLKVWGE